MNSTILMTFLHKSITSESLNDTYREPHLLLDNPFVLIHPLRRISTNDKRSAEFESNSELESLPQMKMTISTEMYHLYKNDAEQKQHDNRSVQPRRLNQSLAIRIFLVA